MEELTPALVASLPKSTVTARIRFIPKADGMRPITRVIGADAKTRVFIYFFPCHQLITKSARCLSAPSFLPQLYQGRVRDLLDILRACVRSRPTLLGSTVWGLGDIHRVLCPVALAQKDKPQPLYFVKVGVCYFFSIARVKIVFHFLL